MTGSNICRAKGKGGAVPVRAIKAYRGGGRAAFIVNLTPDGGEGHGGRRPKLTNAKI
jgi:hypothetical protein